MTTTREEMLARALKAALVIAKQEWDFPGAHPHRVAVVRDMEAALAAQTDVQQEALKHYADQYCEGWCKVSAPEADFSDCGGCKARLALASQTPSEADPITTEQLDKLQFGRMLHKRET